MVVYLVVPMVPCVRPINEITCEGATSSSSLHNAGVSSTRDLPRTKSIASLVYFSFSFSFCNNSINCVPIQPA